MKDRMGVEIKPGDTLVYAWRRGSDLGLNVLQVITVGDGKVVGFRQDDVRRRTVTLQRTDTTVVVTGVPDACV